MDRLDQLAAFVAVAEHNGFAAAARALRRSPAAVTRAVAALEAGLGRALLRRTTRTVRLTADGAGYLPRARGILAEFAAANAAVRGEAQRPGGQLVVTAPVMFGRLHIVPVVVRLLAEHPALSVRLMLVDRLVRLVDEGVDVAVRIAELSDSALHAVRVGEIARVLVASPDYLRRRGTPTSTEALRGHDVVAVDELDPNDEWRWGGRGRSATVVRFKPRLAVNSADAAIAAVQAGLGIARLLSYQVEQALADGSLRRVLPQLVAAPSPVHLMFQDNRLGSVNVRAFVAAARRHLQGLGLPARHPSR